MNRFIAFASLSALLALLALPVLCAIGVASERSAAIAIQLGTVGWFIAAPFWIKSATTLGQ